MFVPVEVVMKLLQKISGMKKAGLSLMLAILYVLLFHAVSVRATQKYILQKGESLSHVAKKFNVTVKELLHVNKFKNPRVLRTGQAVTIPDTADAKTAKAAAAKKVSGKTPAIAKTKSVKVIAKTSVVKYTVKKGDNIWTISKKFNASTKEIKRVNKLTKNKVKAGKTLIIPVKLAAAPAKKKSTALTNSVTVIHGTTVTKAVQQNGSKHFDVESGADVSAMPKVFRFIKGETVRVRKGPGIEFDEIGYVNFGSKVEVLEKDGNWAKIKTGNTEGWCLNVFLSLAKPKRTEYESEVFASSSPHQKVIQLAKAYLGVSYHWGGVTSRGFDCSGFVLAMYRKIGVNLPHSASAQFNIGKPIAFSDLKPGDRVYFHTYKRGASHVGLYIGGGKFIHASSAKRGVIISSLFESYYSKRYLGARR